MLSSILNNQVPHFSYFLKESRCKVPPRVFGSTCFVHDISQGIDNFSRAIKWVFLGYSRVQKGYRCFYHPTHCISISAEVIFFKDTHYFTTQFELDSIHQILLVLYLVQLSLSLNFRILKYHKLLPNHCSLLHVNLLPYRVRPKSRESSPAPASPPTPNLPKSPSNSPNALHKGICSTYNHHPYL